MIRRRFSFSATLGLALAGLVATPTASAQDPIAGGAQERDSTPSDPAALGFLRGSVDRCLYSLAGAGALQVRLQAQMVNSPTGQAPQNLRFETLVDLKTMQFEVSFLGNAQPQAQAYGFARTFANLALTTRPSFVDTRSIVRLSTDGKLVKLQHTPRVKENIRITTTEWYTKDGKPIKRQELRTSGEDSVREETTIELQDLGNGMFVTRREVTSSPGLPRKVLSMEYQNVDGYHVLKRAVIEFPGNSISCDYILTIEPKTPPR